MSEIEKFVVYYRAFRNSQTWRGRSLDDQRQVTSAYDVSPRQIVAVFCESERAGVSDRPQLRAAIEEAVRERAVLVIARLDRLALNPAFITALAESQVEFAACDVPDVNRLALPALAAAAERERRAISARARDALAAAKARGVRLGNPDGRRARQLAAAAQKAAADRRAVSVRPVIERLRAEGLSLRAVAFEMERRGIATMRGGRWSPGKITAILNRAFGTKTVST